MFTIDGYAGIERRKQYTGHQVSRPDFARRLGKRLDLPLYLSYRVYDGFYDVMYDALLHNEGVTFPRMLSIRPTTNYALYRKRDEGYVRASLPWTCRMSVARSFRMQHRSFWDYSALDEPFPANPTDAQVVEILKANPHMQRTEKSLYSAFNSLPELPRNPTFEETVYGHV